MQPLLMRQLQQLPQVQAECTKLIKTPRINPWRLIFSNFMLIESNYLLLKLIFLGVNINVEIQKGQIV